MSKKYKKRRSLIVKISILVSLLVLLCAAAAVYVNTVRIEKLYSIEKERQLSALLDSASVIIKSPLAGDWYIDEPMERIISGNIDIIDCIVVNEDGEVVFDLLEEREGKEFDTGMLSGANTYLSKEVKEDDKVYGEIFIGYQPKTILEDQRTKEIIQFTEIMAGTLRQAISNFKFSKVKIIVEDMVENLEDVTYCIVIHRSGSVLFHSIDKDMEGEKLEDEISVNAARVNPRNPILIQRMTDDESGESFLDVSVLIRDGERRLGIVRVGYSLKSLEDSIRESHARVLLFCAAFAAISILFSLVLAIRISRPVV